MPWDKESFKKHNRRATNQMARMATAMVEGGMDDGKAIRIANAKGKKSKRRRRKLKGNAAKAIMM